MRIHIINPWNDFPSYHGAEVYAAAGAAPRVSVADLATTTLAALVPAHWRIRLTDEGVTPLSDAAIAADDSDLVAITGKVSQRNRMQALARAYRARGRKVVIGGSYASLSPHDMAACADVLVTGEIEDIAAHLFADLEAGRAHGRYIGTRPDLACSPLPRWDLYPNAGALTGCIQTSRGCPFTCDFCDVIQYLGRNQRHKPAAQVARELDALKACGYRQVFLADDNFTVYRRHAHGVLDALRDWNAAQAPDDRMAFMTQASIDLARDVRLMEACTSAGLRSVYVGIETVNEASLRGAGKRQNLQQDAARAVETLVTQGMAVYAGIIVGFDADPPDIFERLASFIQESPMPMVGIGALVAPEGTPLHARLAAEGRLTGDAWQSANNPFATNVVPASMSRDRLLDGLAQLCAEVYAPAAFERRLCRFMQAWGASESPAPKRLSPQPVPLGPDERQVLKRLSGRGPDERRMVLRVLVEANLRPDLQPHIVNFLLRYAQTRHVLQQGGVDVSGRSAATRRDGANALAPAA